MSKHKQKVVLDIINATILPLLVMVMSLLYADKDPTTLPVLVQLLTSHIHSMVTIFVLFVIGYTLFNRLGWPLILATYLLTGFIARLIYAGTTGLPVVNAAVFGSYGLIGVAMVSSFKQRFHLFFLPKLAMRGTAWLLLFVIIDVMINTGIAGSLSSAASLDWKINVLALIIGLVGGIGVKALETAQLPEVLRHIILRTSDTEVVQNTRQPKPKKAPKPQKAPKQKAPRAIKPAVIKPAKPLAGHIPTTSTPIPVFESKNKNKLISQTDLPIIQTPNKPNKLNRAQATPVRPAPAPAPAHPAPADPARSVPAPTPASTPKPPPQSPPPPSRAPSTPSNETDNQSDWLSKHLAMLDEKKKQ